MIIVNRFLQIAERFEHNKIELDQVFSDARPDEVDHVLKALYVIADKRLDMGHPVQLEEIAFAIPDLIEDETVLEAAVEISIDGLIATGQQNHQRAEMLADQLRDLAKTQLQLRSAEIQSDHKRCGPVVEYPKGSLLPRDFGPHDLDGRPRYELRRVLGSGNQGVMYEALDRLFSDEIEPVFVAVKIFHELDSFDSTQSEGIAARRVRHPRVAAIVDHGVADTGECYVVYEIVRGLPLDDWVKRNPSISTDEKLRIVIEIARGVQAAHASGIVHRDLKPGNIIMSDANEPVITDFGIASKNVQQPSTTGRYGTRGSLAFMAPEQYMGESSYIPLVDVYALGGILYWLFTGSFPNGDRISEAIGWLDEHDNGGPSRGIASIPNSTLRAVLVKALALDPNDRYQSAEALSYDLKCIVGSRPVEGVHESRWVRAGLFVKRNRLLVAAYALVLMVVAVAASLVVRHQAMQDMRTASIEHEKQVELLNHAIEIETLKTEEFAERMVMAREMVGSWVKTLDAEESESAVLFNLLFLHSQSLNGPLASDTQFLSELLERRLDVAVEYAEALNPETISPIERALWFEMIAGWLKTDHPERAAMYSDRAARLVEQVAPTDIVWLEELRSQ